MKVTLEEIFYEVFGVGVVEINEAVQPNFQCFIFLASTFVSSTAKRSCIYDHHYSWSSFQVAITSLVLGFFSFVGFVLFT